MFAYEVKYLYKRYMRSFFNKYIYALDTCGYTYPINEMKQFYVQKKIILVFLVCYLVNNVACSNNVTLFI